MNERVEEPMKTRLTIDLLLLVLLVFNRGNVDGRLVREELAAWCEIFVPCQEDGIEHGFV
jgi:hypothetical protein